MESYSLFQLNEYIRRVIALNFREPLWIEAEITQVRESRGNHYLELVEKEEDGEKIIAQVSAAIWYRKFQFIKRKLGDIIYDLLVDGTQVRIKCMVDYHERYGLKLLVEDIDPNYTFGQLELKRQEIINRLEEEGLMEINKSELIPSVIQKIAVISSSGAAGYQDFINQLTNNSYGYAFDIDLYDSAVQGEKVEADTCHAIASIVKDEKQYHIVAIIRGGGSKLDLAGYDNYEIAKAIALSQVPFVIGIGHDIDSTVTDLVSCLSLKTPTAVADYILERNMNFEARLEQSSNQLYNSVVEHLRREEIRMSSMQQQLSLSFNYRINEEISNNEHLESLLHNAIDNLFRAQQHTLEKIALAVEARDPQSILEQGFAYLTMEDKHVRSVKEMQQEDVVAIHLNDGSLQSRIL